MPPFPKEPHLFVYRRNDNVVCVVRAASPNEAREYMQSIEKTSFQKLSPSEAFEAARLGIQILNAKPEYADVDAKATDELFPETNELGPPPPVAGEDAGAGSDQ